MTIRTLHSYPVDIYDACHASFIQVSVRGMIRIEDLTYMNAQFDDSGDYKSHFFKATHPSAALASILSSCSAYYLREITNIVLDAKKKSA